MDEENNIAVQLPTEDGIFTDEVLDTLTIPSNDNPDDREYEEIEIEEEGGK